MAVKTKITFTAVNWKVGDKLAQLKPVQAYNMARKALLHAGLIVVGKAKELTPVDTGLLRSSIDVQIEPSTVGHITANVGTNVNYAMYVEFGTGPMGKAGANGAEFKGINYRATPWTYRYIPTKGGDKKWHYAKTNGQPPRPYLYPAFISSKQAVIDDMSAFLDDAIVKVLGAK